MLWPLIKNSLKESLLLIRVYYIGFGQEVKTYYRKCVLYASANMLGIFSSAWRVHDKEESIILFYYQHKRKEMTEILLWIP